ncbi:hypothetical protein [Paenibacillus sp. URB8-2]|uniref:hypothetical protein n=1 Tax=Paenibacillus sp. URB8-2 TaxID=2741301 RepID=UPI0015BD75F9|nr:hypothetical protein [Paenibacillus sp. URB8-2]BCG60442.1 hypothetical protein PUR_38670 [Paenibacillus sp. URB8-2]
MAVQLSSLNNLNINPDLVHRALNTGKGDSTLISDFINQALKSYVNKSKLEVRGFTETMFYFSNQEVKKIFVKSIVKYEIKHNPYDHVNNPNFNGIVYPSTLFEVFITPKANILVQKSIDHEIQFCKGQIINEQKMFRTTDLIKSSGAEYARTLLPSPLFKLVEKAYLQLDTARIPLELDTDYYQELEL